LEPEAVSAQAEKTRTEAIQKLAEALGGPQKLDQAAEIVDLIADYAIQCIEAKREEETS
jgi:hypothetical protein